MGDELAQCAKAEIFPTSNAAVTVVVLELPTAPRDDLAMRPTHGDETP